VSVLRESQPAEAALLERRQLTPGWNPEQDADYAPLIERVLGSDAELL
jgi:hypothetical protein